MPLVSNELGISDERPFCRCGNFSFNNIEYLMRVGECIHNIVSRKRAFKFALSEAPFVSLRWWRESLGSAQSVNSKCCPVRRLSTWLGGIGATKRENDVAVILASPCTVHVPTDLLATSEGQSFWSHLCSMRRTSDNARWIYALSNSSLIDGTLPSRNSPRPKYKNFR